MTAATTTKPSEPPRLVLVASQSEMTVRVRNMALAAAGDGWAVTVVCPGTAAETTSVAEIPQTERWTVGPVEVLRVPVGRAMKKREMRRRRFRSRSVITQAGWREMPTLQHYRSAHEVRQRRRSVRLASLSAQQSPAPALSRLGLRVAARTAEKTFALRARLFMWEDERRRDARKPLGSWPRDWPEVLDLDHALGPVIESLEPALVQSTDVMSLLPAATAVARLRSSGRAVVSFHDALERVADHKWPNRRVASAAEQLSAELIPRVDVVVTVGPEASESLQRTFALGSAPVVVRDAPVRAALQRETGRSVRRSARVPDDSPLAVCVASVNGSGAVSVVVEALTAVPQLHLAIAIDRTDPGAARVEQLAVDLGVADRVHLIALPVPELAVDMLRTADLGVLTDSGPDDWGLPPSLGIFVHAGLVLLAPAATPASAHVEAHGLGSTFAAHDATSVARALETGLDRAREANTPRRPAVAALSWEEQNRPLLHTYRTSSGAVLPDGAPIDWSDIAEIPVITGADRPEESTRPGPATSATPVETTVSWRPLRSTPVRLGLAPANYAGQLASIAQAVTAALPDVSAEVSMYTSPRSFGYPADVYLPRNDLGRLEVQLAQVERFLPRYTHVIADAFLPVFGSLNGNDIEGDLASLRRAGIEVALLAHGSEIRDPDRHMERTRYSHFFDAPDEGMVRRVRETTRRNADIARSSGLPIFVTTPDLLDDMPEAIWVPLVVDTEAWHTNRNVMERERPVVLHAPSKRWTKGTNRFLTSMEKLAATGLIDFELVEGLPWSQMRERVQNADIVIDQFAVGCYGTFACEAMAAGKPVIAHLTDTVVETIGVHTPIINSTPDLLIETIEQLVADREGTARIGADSAAFVREFHDGTRSARALQTFLGLA